MFHQPKYPLIFIVTIVLVTGLVFSKIFLDFFDKRQHENVALKTVDLSSNTHGNKESVGQSSVSSYPSRESSPQQASLSRKIPPLQTIDERQQYHDDLLKEPVESVWSIWRESTADDYGGEQQIIADMVLTQLLRKEENKFIYGEIENSLGQTSLKLGERATIVNLLGEASTPEALTIVLNTLKKEPNSNLRPALLAGLGDFNCWQADGGYKTSCAEMSAPLEVMWATTPVESYEDKELLRALTGTIAKIGAPSGVNLLLETISEYNNLNSISLENDPRTYIVLMSIGEISNDEALPVLKQWRDRINNPTMKARITEVIDNIES